MLASAVAVTAAVSVALAGCRNEFAERLTLELPPGPEVGRPAPVFEATALDGATVRLADLRGRAVLLNSWATWCLPCLEEMPELEELQRLHPAEELAVVGVSIDALPLPEIQEFLDEHGITYRNLWARADDLHETFDWGRGVPKTVLIDANGVIRGYWAGRFRPFDPENEVLIDATLR
jgi:cytochrome c-type biogenesis protein